MRTEKVELTNMCMIANKNNQVLIQRRKKSWKGCAFPGGHVEKMESIITSTIREVKEETGLNINNLKQCGIKQWFDNDGIRNICFLYYTNDYTGDLISTDEGENFWCKLEDVLNLDIAKSFDKMFKVFINEQINELYHKRRSKEKTDYIYY